LQAITYETIPNGMEAIKNKYQGRTEVRWRLGKKQVWCPHVRTGLLGVNVLY